MPFDGRSAENDPQHHGPGPGQSYDVYANILWILNDEPALRPHSLYFRKYTFWNYPTALYDARSGTHSSAGCGSTGLINERKYKMANFFSKLFGKGKEGVASSPQAAIQEILDGIIEKGGFDLAAVVEPSEEGFFVNFSGGDSHLVTNREGMLLDSFQIFIKRMLQNKFSDQKIEVSVDCDGFMEESAQELRDLADKLKGHVLDKGTPSYVRALPPRERKIVHRYLAEDGRVKSQSVGDGFCKKIKITRVNAGDRNNRSVQEETYV